jgi:hypothetical protein
MFDLIVLSCVGVLNSVCTFTMVDYSYPSLDRCRMAAAMTAGRNRARIVDTRPRDRMVYWYKCGEGAAVPGSDGWTRVEGSTHTADAHPPF